MVQQRPGVTEAREKLRGGGFFVSMEVMANLGDRAAYGLADAADTMAHDGLGSIELCVDGDSRRGQSRSMVAIEDLSAGGPRTEEDYYHMAQAHGPFRSAAQRLIEAAGVPVEVFVTDRTVTEAVSLERSRAFAGHLINLAQSDQNNVTIVPVHDSLWTPDSAQGNVSDLVLRTSDGTYVYREIEPADGPLRKGFYAPDTDVSEQWLQKRHELTATVPTPDQIAAHYEGLLAGMPQ